ncbi:uncharacterized protein MYCFIDRAFT_169118 [Pseudocercospora fijiensis CIRAD86]|uniref:Uncharacterized protein n=1 Tax=Pseudocercospora fijiensis (strain CIRAD86) TaxID=383855 RepID=N1Q8K8_PSEFD|nr:uncharacterized protein MYCFIDRAFT_169118 [Pseudocercospora fijiensis CIRAD86]EME87257.1 hypothetical protein MYCFIDRAFT_169118 [Pseudocercospora fijiensis CIRAD86]
MTLRIDISLLPAETIRIPITMSIIIVAAQESNTSLLAKQLDDFSNNLAGLEEMKTLLHDVDVAQQYIQQYIHYENKAELTNYTSSNCGPEICMPS